MTDGKEKQEKRGVMDRVSSKKTPLNDCTNTMKLKIEHDEEGRKLHTKGQWKRIAIIVGMGKNQQQLSIKGGQDNINGKRRMIHADSGQKLLKKLVIEEDGRMVDKESMATNSEVEKISREWSQIYK